MTKKAWALFAAMSVVWGMSYLFIKIAVEEVSAPVVVVTRTAIAAAVLVPLALHRRAFGSCAGACGSCSSWRSPTWRGRSC